MSLRDEFLGDVCKVEIGDLACDASIREVHALEAETTEHTIESGAKISDHYRLLPKVLTIQCCVSKTPLAVGFPGQTTINSVKNLSNNSDPVSAAWLYFKNIMEDAQRISIKTSKYFYLNMVIKSVQDPREGPNDWMIFDLVASEMRTAFTDSVEALAQKEKEASKRVLEEKKDKGKQAAAEAESKSLLAQGVDGLAAFFGG